MWVHTLNWRRILVPPWATLCPLGKKETLTAPTHLAVRSLWEAAGELSRIFAKMSSPVLPSETWLNFPSYNAYDCHWRPLSPFAGQRGQHGSPCSAACGPFSRPVRRVLWSLLWKWEKQALKLHVVWKQWLETEVCPFLTPQCVTIDILAFQGCYSYIYK